MTRFSRTLALAAISISLASVTACLGDSIGGASSNPTVEETTFASSLNVDLTKYVRTTHGAYYKDLTVGTGALVAAGDSLSARYTGWLSTGSQFGSNVTDATPFGFRLGASRVIPGWDEGIPGMHVGGTRQLLIPPSLAYGIYGQGSIPGNAVLVFNVQIVGNP